MKTTTNNDVMRSSNTQRGMDRLGKEVQKQQEQKRKGADRTLQNNQYYGGGANGYNVYNYGGGGGGAGGAEGENYWLSGYSIKVVACLQGEQSINYERGEIESSTVIFRLCPASTCGADSNSTSLGCTDGYGEYSVGINTFAEAFAESIRDNYQYYDLSQMSEYMRECRMFEGYNQGGQGGGGGGANYYYGGGGGSYTWIGPTCTADGTNIRLGAFSDPYCSDEVSFGSVYDGATLPYSSQGIIPSSTCMSCYSQNYDNYDWEINQVCRKTYEDASQRCEKRMDVSSSSSSSSYGYGYNTHYNTNYGCDYLDEKMESVMNGSTFTLRGQNSGSSSELRNTILMFLLVATVSAGVVMLFVRHKKQKSLKNESGSSDGGFELMDPKEALSDAVREGSTKTMGLMKDASKSVRKSIHESAKRLADLTRSQSTSPIKKQSTRMSKNTSEDDAPYADNEDFVMT